MSERFVIEVEISSEEAKLLRRVAELTGQSVENLLSRRMLPLLPNASLDTQLAEVATYSDEQLWAIVETAVLTDEEVKAWDVLVERAKQGKALEGDRTKSQAFSELYNKRGLLRAKALAELLARSYDVHSYLEKNMPQ